MGLFTNKTQNRPWEMIHSNKKHPQDVAFLEIAPLRAPNARKTGRFFKRKSTTHDRCRSGIHASLEIEIGGPLGSVFILFFGGGGVVAQSKSVFFEEFRV